MGVKKDDKRASFLFICLMKIVFDLLGKLTSKSNYG